MSENENLAGKTCVPCQGGVPRLDLDTSSGLMDRIENWALNEDATRIERQFSFKNFVEALSFCNKIGELAELEGHHPDINLGWGYCNVTFQTHKIRGLHENDFIMAAKVNDIADRNSA
jgi:4a-hydroxytetrahydrobiopterin dehydratase